MKNLRKIGNAKNRRRIKQLIPMPAVFGHSQKYTDKSALSFLYSCRLTYAVSEIVKFSLPYSTLSEHLNAVDARGMDREACDIRGKPGRVSL